MKKLALSAMISAGLFLGGPALAQEEEEAPNLADGWFMTPKQGHEDEFEEAIEEHIEYRTKKGDPRTWQVYQPIVGKKLNYYAIRACCFDWADFDAHREWGEENEEVGEHFDENVAEHVEYYQHYWFEMDLENSNWPEMEDGPWPYYGVTRWIPEPGESGINAMKERLSKIAMEGGLDSNWLWEWRIGGTDELSVITPFENYADMAEPDKTLGQIIAEKMGSEDDAMEMFAEFGDKFETVTYTVYRHRADLSAESDD